jgi:hypothetical protein
MAADVHECAQLSAAVAQHHQRHVAEARGEVRTGLGELSGVTGVVPAVPEQPVAFAVEDLGVGVPVIGQRVRASSLTLA